MKTQKLIDLERDRLGLIADARSILDEMKDCTDSKAVAALEARHDAAMRAVDANALDIEEERLHAAEEEARAADRPGMGGGEVSADGGLGHFHHGWTDQRGEPVRVLASNERFATTTVRGLSFGDHIRALAVGPRNDAEARALSEGTASAGGYTVPTPLASEFIDRLRAQTVVIRAGARTVPMSSETLAIARLDTDPAVAWRLENTLIDDSDPAFSRVLLEAKTLAGLVKVSRELLQDSVNVSEILTNAFSKVMAIELDRVAMWGDGTDDGPVGITATSGINEVSMGTDGSVFTWEKAIDAVYEMQVDNAADPTAMIMHPRTGAYIGKMKDGNGQWIAPPPMLSSLPKLTTTAVPITETQGSAVNASSIVFGDFKHLFIGMRDQMNVTVLKERYADYGQIGFLVWMRADVQLAHKASFCRLKGIIPAA